MSDFYTNHLLKRYLSGDILAQEKITLKALLEPCILKNTADEQQRIVFSQLVRPSPAPSSCLQPSPAPSRRAPVRACNQPFLTLFVVPIGKTYNILSNDSKPNQPKTDNMHFTLTNFNGYKSDANKGFTKPRFETHESENAVSIVKECTNPCGATLYDMKTLWVCFYKMPPNFQKEFKKSARSLKKQGNKTAAAKMVALINHQSADTISKTTVWEVTDAIEIVKHMDKRLFYVTKDGCDRAWEAYKVDGLKEPLHQVLQHYSGEIVQPKGIRSWKKLVSDANKQKVHIPKGMLKYLRDAAAHYPTVPLKQKKIAELTAANWGNPSVSAQAIQDVYDSGDTYSMESGEAGVSIESKMKHFWHAMISMAYQEDIKVTNGIIEKLQGAESLFKTFKKSKTKPSKKPNHTFVKDKAAEKEIKQWTMVKTSKGTFQSRYPKRSLTEFQEMLRKRTDVRYAKPTKDWKCGYTPQRRPIKMSRAGCIAPKRTLYWPICGTNGSSWVQNRLIRGSSLAPSCFKTQKHGRGSVISSVGVW